MPFGSARIMSFRMRSFSSVEIEGGFCAEDGPERAGATDMDPNLFATFSIEFSVVSEDVTEGGGID